MMYSLGHGGGTLPAAKAQSYSERCAFQIEIDDAAYILTDIKSK